MARNNNNNYIINNINYDEEENWDVVNANSEILQNVEEDQFLAPRSTQIQEINNYEDMWDMGPRIQFGAPSTNEVRQYDHVKNEEKNQNVVVDVERTEINNSEDMWDMAPRIQFSTPSSTKVRQYGHAKEDERNQNAVVDVECTEINNTEDMWDMAPRIQFGAPSTNEVRQYDHAEEDERNQNAVVDVERTEINNTEDMWNMAPGIQFGAPSTTEVRQYGHAKEDERNQNAFFDVEQTEINNTEDMWDIAPEIQFGAPSTTEVRQYGHAKEDERNQNAFFDVEQTEINNTEDMWDIAPEIQFGAPSTTEVWQYDHVKEDEKNQNVVFDVERTENHENTWNDNNIDETNIITTNGKNVEPQREVYIPPEPSNDEHDIFGTGIPLGINFGKLDQIKVEVSGENISTAINSFEELHLDATLMDNIKRSGYTRPTKIQKYSIPVVMAERDLMACGQTGSGKTAAFIIPILNKLISNPKNITVENHIEPQVVIVSPTRELALQIYHEARKFAFNTRIHTEIAYGGTSVNHQLARIQKGCHVLVATPGRLNAFVKRGVIKFSSIRFLVLDEADRMLDMGFLSDMESIIKHPTMVPTGDRRTLMFSATFPEDIQKLAANFLQNYIFVTVGIVGGASTDVQQAVCEVEKVNKRKKLVEVLNESENKGTLVFVETKLSADFIAAFLNQKNIRTTSIHGDRLQSGREEALRDFRSGKSHVLVATSVAARGLDIRCVKHVINYDLPKNIDDYVHRIGRTGRIGNLGKATSFYDRNHDSGIAVRLAGILEQAGQNVPQFLLYGQNAAENNVYAFGDRDMRENCTQVTVYEEERWD